MNLKNSLVYFNKHQSDCDFDWSENIILIKKIIMGTIDCSDFQKAVDYDFESGILIPIDLMIYLFDRWILISKNKNKSIKEKIKYLSYYDSDFKDEIELLNTL